MSKEAFDKIAEGMKEVLEECLWGKMEFNNESIAINPKGPESMPGLNRHERRKGGETEP